MIVIPSLKPCIMPGVPKEGSQLVRAASTKANVIHRPTCMQTSFLLPSESGPSCESCWSTPCPWRCSRTHLLSFLFKVSFDFVEIQQTFGVTRVSVASSVSQVDKTKKKGIKINCGERDEAMRTCNKRLPQGLL